MIQLTYQAAFDSYHAIFRLLRLRAAGLMNRPVHRDHVRILDFYLLFPRRTEQVRLKPQDRRFKRLAAEYAQRDTYVDLPDDHLLFARMRPMQHAAIDTLTNEGYFKSEETLSNLVVASDRKVPSELVDRIENANVAEKPLMDFLDAFSAYPLIGPNGVKARTGLLEYRYDPV